MNLLTTKQAAVELSVTIRWVQQLIKTGLLKAEKTGRDYFIDRNELDKVRHRKPSGRPRKTK